MKKKILCLAAVIALYSLGVNAQKYTVTNTEKQTIDGFGASDAWSFWQIGEWEDSLQTKVADWLFSSENDDKGNPRGIGLSIWRFNAGAGSAEQGDSAKINRDTRTNYFASQKGQRRFLHLAKERGVPTFLAFFNTPPVDLTINGLGTNTGRGGTFNLRDDAYDDFAKYAADMIQAAEKEDGIHFDYLCPVNEPDGHWNWQGPKQEGTPATNREIARIAREMSKEFLDRGLTTKILVNESSDYRCMFSTHQTTWERGYEIQAFWNPDSTDTYVGNLPNIAHVMAGHSYWTNTPVLNPTDKKYNRIGLYGYRKRLADEFAKVNKKLQNHPAWLAPHKEGYANGAEGGSNGVGFWMTELCIMGNDEEIHGGGGFDFTMEVALYVARTLHYDLTVANARSWQWWRAAGGNYKDGLIRMYVKGERTGRRGSAPVRENFVRDSKLMWVLGNYSRFVRPGAVRLDVQGDMSHDGIMISAYKNVDGATAVVAINYSKKDKEINLSSGKAKSAIAYRTSDVEDENLKCMGKVGLKKAQLPARSVTTYIIK